MKHKSIKTVSYAIADDDPLFIQLLSSTLSQNLQLKKSFCATNGRQLLDLFAQNKTEVLFVDLFMPVISGVEAISILREQHPDLKIVAYSSIYQQEYAALLKSLHVNVYCEREPEIIYRWLENTEYSPEYLNTIYLQEWKERDEIKKATLPATPKKAELSTRELQVIALICEGKTNSEIGETLNLSKRSIDTYIPRILDKLNLRNTRELAIFGFKNGFCKLDCPSNDELNCARHSIFNILVERKKKGE